jgi:hypothetical protein
VQVFTSDEVIPMKPLSKTVSTALLVFSLLLLSASLLASSALAVPDTAYSAKVGENVKAQGLVIRPLSFQKNAVLFSVDGSRVRVLKGENQMVKGKKITLTDITYPQQERTSLVSFAFTYGGRFKNLVMTAQEKKSLAAGKSYELTLDFVGQENGNDVAVFTLNGERSKPLEAREDFVFEDGSRLFVKSVLRHRSSTTITTPTAIFTVA